MNNDQLVRSVFRSSLFYNILTAFFHALGILSNAVLIGNFLGDRAMAAYGIINPVFILYSAIGATFGMGGSVLTGHYLGKHRFHEANEIFSIIIGASLIFSILLTALGLGFANNTAYLLGADNSSITLCSGYLRGLSFGALPVILMNTLLSFVRNDGSARISLYASLTVALTSITLGLLNCFVFELGIFGFGISISISYTLALLVLARHFFLPTNTLRFLRPREYISNFRNIVKYGFSNTVLNFGNLLRTIVLNNLLSLSVGYVGVSALSVQGSINSLLSTVSMGFGSALLYFNSILTSEEDDTCVTYLVKNSLKDCLMITLVIVAITLFSLSPLVSFFGKNNPEVIGLAIVAARYLALSLPFYTVNILFLNYYESSGHEKHAYFIAASSSFFFPVTLSLLFYKSYGANGIFASFLYAQILTGLGTFILVWIHDRHFPKKLKDYLFFPKRETNAITFNLSVENTKEAVLALSAEINNYFRKYLKDKERSFYLALCVDEILNNTVAYGYPDNRKAMIDLFIKIKKDGGIILRIRDDSDPFNPVKQLEVAEDEHQEHLGLRMVEKLAVIFEYRHSNGLNNLLIKL